LGEFSTELDAWESMLRTRDIVLNPGEETVIAVLTSVGAIPDRMENDSL